MNSNLCYASVETLTPTDAWTRISDTERIARVAGALANKFPEINKLLVISAAKEDGQVIVSLLQPLPPSERGTVLLDLEAGLKESVDVGLTVWLEALGDRNSLRNLRGIEVNAS